MSEITNPVILDKTGVVIADGLKSIAAALWAEKAPIIKRKAVNFYDFDGERVYSYDKAEFLGLSALPANPAHDGLTAQGWNWSLADAQAYVEKYGVLDIGQMYITDDGKTRLYIEIGHTENLTVHIQFNQSVANGATFDWGDGSETETYATSGNASLSHTYAAEGKYIITMEAAEGCTVRLGQNTGSSTTLVGVGGLADMLLYQGPTGRIAGKDVLAAIEIGAGVTDIGSAAFANMTNLKYVTIPNTCTTFRDITFNGCIKLRSITYPAGVTRIGNYANSYCYQLKVCSIPASVTAIGNAAFKTDTELNRVCIPEGVTALGIWVCAGLHTAEEIVVPDTITGAIPNYAFYHCYAIEKINLPDGITSIGQYAFYHCTNLRDCELPEGVTTIGYAAFGSCFAFLDFVIPSTVTSIAGFAFLYMDGVATFHVKATTPPALEATAFATIVADSLVIYVPYSADHSVLEAYKAATGWSSKVNYIVEEDAPEGTEETTTEEEGGGE